MNTDGDSNTAVGFHALLSNTTGSNNIAIGVGALANQTGGDLNTAVGSNAGSGVVTAGGVICIGADVGGVDVSNTTWIGNGHWTGLRTHWHRVVSLAGATARRCVPRPPFRRVSPLGTCINVTRGNIECINLLHTPNEA